jgi:hypothetical protein
MALTELQRAICRLIADNRIASGELCRAEAADLGPLVAQARVGFHARSIRGALPVIRG